ncbi:hypothetical protein JB92DRAFT_2827607 [Gautieria morchelliformis]|nr:hypothetical protein JB92DRAFT_2827607 [Gautieria morchelliformis]
MAWLGLKAVALAWLALALACKSLSQAVGTWPGSAPAWPWLGPWPVGGEWIVDTDFFFFSYRGFGRCGLQLQQMAKWVEISEHRCPFWQPKILDLSARLASWLGSGLSKPEPGPGAGCANGLGLVWLGLSAAWPGSADGLGRAVPITKLEACCGV